MVKLMPRKKKNKSAATAKQHKGKSSQGICEKGFRKKTKKRT
jgi:hypothetical protein